MFYSYLQFCFVWELFWLLFNLYFVLTLCDYVLSLTQLVNSGQTYFLDPSRFPRIVSNTQQMTSKHLCNRSGTQITSQPRVSLRKTYWYSRWSRKEKQLQELDRAQRPFFKTYLFGFIGSQLRYMRSLVAAWGIQFPDQGSNPGHLHWEHRLLATGPPGKSPHKGLLCKKTEGSKETTKTTSVSRFLSSFLSFQIWKQGSFPGRICRSQQLLSELRTSIIHFLIQHLII